MVFFDVSYEKVETHHIRSNPLRHSNIVGSKTHQTMSQILQSFDFWTNRHFPLAGRR